MALPNRIRLPAHKGEGAALAEEGTLTPLSILGLHSAVRVGITVNLWTYHHSWANLLVDDFDNKVVLHDAREIVPLEEMMSMLENKWPWGNISDIVRFKAADAWNERDSLVLDLDTIWLRPPDAQHLPCVTGHRFATCAAAQRVSEDSRYGELAMGVGG